jgi:hypothetical protein
MPRPSLVASVLLAGLVVGFWPAASAFPPAGPSRKDLLGKLAQVQADMNKQEIEEAKELGRIYERYAAERRKAATPLGKLFGELNKLRAEERAELAKAVDPAKVKAIKEKYAQQIADLEKQLKPKEEALAKLTAKRDAELAKIEGEWWAELTKLDAPALKVAELRAKERRELYGLIDPTKAKAIEAAYAPKFAELEKERKALAKALEEARAKRLADVAAARAGLQEQLNLLDPPEGRLADRIAQLRAERDASLADADTPEKKKEVQTGFDLEIKALQGRAKELGQDMALAQTQALNQIAAADAAYWAAVAKLDPPGDSLADKRARLHEQERAEIANTADPAKVKAIKAAYDAQIQALEAEMQSREGAIAQLAQKKRKEEAKVIAAWYAQFIKADPAQEALLYKLALVRVKEQAELGKALDPVKVEAVRAAFAPKFAEVQKKINDQEKALTVQTQKQREEMTKVIDKYALKLAPMQKHAAELIDQIQKAKR